MGLRCDQMHTAGRLGELRLALQPTCIQTSDQKSPRCYYSEPSSRDRMERSTQCSAWYTRALTSYSQHSFQATTKGVHVNTFLPWRWDLSCQTLMLRYAGSYWIYVFRSNWTLNFVKRFILLLLPWFPLKVFQSCAGFQWPHWLMTAPTELCLKETKRSLDEGQYPKGIMEVCTTSVPFFLQINSGMGTPAITFYL